MDGQTLVVALIVLGAVAYTGSLLWKRVGSFSTRKKSCEAGCGCAGDSAKVVK